MKYLSHFLALACLFTPLSVSTWAGDGVPVAAKNVAHRGFSAAAPENTLASIRAAIEIGAHGCEMDVYASADGILFLNHDGNLKRYTGRDVKVSTLTLAELQREDVGSYFKPEFRGEPIPTLDQAIALLAASDCVPVIELKQNGLEQRVLDVLDRYNMRKRCIIIAFSAAACREMRRLDRDIFVCWLVGRNRDETEDAYLSRILTTLDDCNINAVDMQFGGMSANVVQTLHDRGIRVFCWTVDKESDMRRMLDLGADSVTTNRPDVLKSVLESYPD